MAKGKWAQGIKPRQFHWVVQDKLAICERPGGYGANHRRVRRQEEIIWIRENNFAFVISLIPSDHNLHSYDELGMPWRHWPLAATMPPELSLPQVYREMATLLDRRAQLLLHMEEVGDRMAGFVAGYLRWTKMVPVTYEAITVVESILARQMGPTGRSIVTAAAELAELPDGGIANATKARAEQDEAEDTSSPGVVQT